MRIPKNFFPALRRRGLWLFVFVTVSRLSIAPAKAQGQSPAQQMVQAQGNIDFRAKQIKGALCEQSRRIEVAVLNETKVPLDRQSVAKLQDQHREITTWQTTSDESSLTFCNIDVGDYALEISAVGYITSHKEVTVTGASQIIRLEVLMQKDPAAADLNASEETIPAPARKDAKRAVSALKSANFKEAQKRLDKAYQIAPSSAQVNFLYGYLFLQLNDLDKSESYLSRSAMLDPRRAQTLTLLGRLQLQRRHNDDALHTLERAVSANSNDWLAHDLLADAYLRQKNFDKAREQAQLALEEGKGAASAAQLVLGQALANSGHDQEGVLALRAFLQSDPGSSVARQVQGMIGTIEARGANKTKFSAGEAAGASAGGAETASAQPAMDLALEAAPAALPASAWGPPSVDDVKPTVAPGVACPYQQVLDESGERVKQLVDNITRFAAIEDMLHEQLDPAGNPLTKETRKFDYVASISETKSGYLETEEFRNLRYGVSDLPDHVVTTGFVGLALIFHPDMRDSYKMECEGLGQWQGHATWLMHFQQRDDKPSRFAEYVVGTARYPMKLKGRAWISADNFQVLRIESDLVNALPQLAVQHQIAEYGPVDFQQKKVQLWLPQNVDIYLDLNHRRYYRRHSFDHYMLFSVNSEDKQPANQKPPQTNPGQNP